MMQPLQAFCFHCRDMRAMCQQRAVVFKNGSKAVRGQCLACRQEVYRIGNLVEVPRRRHKPSLVKPFVVSFVVTFIIAYTVAQISLL